MKYRGTINFDFSGGDGNAYTRLKLALVEAGWINIETSALVIETDDVAKVWRGIELVAKGAAAVGNPSAVTFHLQGSDDFAASIPIKSTQSPKNALEDLLKTPFPTPKP